jgi:hypothetical protein
MQVSPETIYQALYVQGRGHLCADLHQHLRTGRAVRRPRRSTAKGSFGQDPGHDLDQRTPRRGRRSSRARTLGRRPHLGVELPLGHRHLGGAAGPVHDAGPPAPGPRRHSRARRPGGRQQDPARAPTQVADVGPGHRAGPAPPDHPGHEDGHLLLRPALPLAAGTNENTNGLLRQYFSKGTDLSIHSPDRLLEVATELNARPRQTLARITPAEALQQLLFDPEPPIVATTA